MDDIPVSRVPRDPRPGQVRVAQLTLAGLLRNVADDVEGLSQVLLRAAIALDLAEPQPRSNDELSPQGQRCVALAGELSGAASVLRDVANKVRPDLPAANGTAGGAHAS